MPINWNPFSETWRNLRLAKQDRTVFLSLLGISWLWFVGATFLTSFFNFAKDVLSANPNGVTILLATFSISIGTGSLLCERFCRRSASRSGSCRWDRSVLCESSHCACWAFAERRRIFDDVAALVHSH